MLIRFLLIPLMLIAAAAIAQTAGTEDLESQRRLYHQAQEALSRGDNADFKRFKRRLADYPLYPYLTYAELERRLSRASVSEIENFTSTYADTLLASRLQGNWLHALMRQGRWQTFLEHYDHRADTELACYYARARIRAGQLDGVTEDALELWRVGHSQPEACDRLFAWLKDQDAITVADRWERIQNAMETGNTGLAAYVAKPFSERDREWVNLWQRVHNDPARWLSNRALREDRLITRTIILHGVRRLARLDAERAREFWNAFKHDHAYSDELRLEMDRRVALHAAYQQHPRALAWLNKLPATAINDDVRRWRARAALYALDWRALSAAIEDLAPAQRRFEQWRYWRARAWEQLGRKEEAAELYAELAKERGYYGFLAADRTAADYSIAHTPLLDDPENAEALLEQPDIRRARELYHVDQRADARLEWNHAIRNFDNDDLKRAAVLASKWGWHADAILTVARTGDWDDLTLRFPTPFETEVLHAAEKRGIEPAWMYGIMRRESAFNEVARSPAGALGLMQVMPRTARHVAGELGLREPHWSDLLNGAYNIRLGAAYLRAMLDRFGGHRILASAAYNAGPQRVNRWLPERDAVPADVWVDIIPYPETRNYVRAVMEYTAVFEHRLDLEFTRLSQRMPPIRPLDDLAARGEEERLH